MLNLQAIEEQLAKGDPALKDVYLKLKARLTPSETPKQLPVEEAVMENVGVQEDGSLVKSEFICSKCSKVCASNAGRAAHERKCNK